jgi:hypothetical protein
MIGISTFVPLFTRYIFVTNHESLCLIPLTCRSPFAVLPESGIDRSIVLDSDVPDHEELIGQQTATGRPNVWEMAFEFWIVASDCR